MRRLRFPSRWSRLRATLLTVFCCFGLLGWQGVSTLGRNGAVDSGEHLAYAQYLDAHGSLPGKALNYEYATPPLFHGAAIAVQYLLHRVPSHAAEPTTGRSCRPHGCALPGKFLDAASPPGAACPASPMASGRTAR